MTMRKMEPTVADKGHNIRLCAGAKKDQHLAKSF